MPVVLFCQNLQERAIFTVKRHKNVDEILTKKTENVLEYHAKAWYINNNQTGCSAAAWFYPKERGFDLWKNAITF